VRTVLDTVYGGVRFREAFEDPNNEPVTGRQFASKPIALALPFRAVLYPTGLEVPPDLSIDDWRALGEHLIKFEGSVQWSVGDWWSYGYHQYGRRKAMAKRLGLSFGYLMNLGYVARRVKTSFRNEVLSWSHHCTVAHLSQDLQKRFLDASQREGWTVLQLREAINKHWARLRGDRPEIDALRYAERLIKVAQGGYNALNKNIVAWPDLIKNHDCFAHLSEPQLREVEEAVFAVADGWNEVRDALIEYRPKQTMQEAAE